MLDRFRASSLAAFLYRYIFHYPTTRPSESFPGSRQVRDGKIAQAIDRLFIGY